MTKQLENEDLEGSPDGRSTRSNRWAVRAFRIPITLAAVMLFNQAVNAGEFMSGRFEALEFHRFGATAAEILVLLAVTGAGWARFRRRYTWWPVGVTALLLVAIQVQE